MSRRFAGPAFLRSFGATAARPTDLSIGYSLDILPEIRPPDVAVRGLVGFRPKQMKRHIRAGRVDADFVGFGEVQFQHAGMRGVTREGEVVIDVMGAGVSSPFR